MSPQPQKPNCQVNIFAAQDVVPSQAPLHMVHEGLLQDANQKVISLESPIPSHNYYITVASSSAIMCPYTLLVSTSQGYTYLLDGKSVINNRVTFGKARWFIFDEISTNSQDFYITAMPSSGNIELYVSTEHIDPNNGNASWKSRDRRLEFVVIPWDDPQKHGKKRYFISVYGAEHPIMKDMSYFSIQATLDETQIALEDGGELSSVVPMNGYRYFKFDVPSSNNGLFFELELDDAMNSAELYVSKRYARPTESRKEVASSSFGTRYVRMNDAQKVLIILESRDWLERLTLAYDSLQNCQRLTFTPMPSPRCNR